MRTAQMFLAVALFVMFGALLYAADINGKWTGTADQGFDVSFTFKVDGAKLTGTMAGQDGKDLEIKDGKVDGDSISFNVDSEWQGQPVKLVMSGKAGADNIQLHMGTEDDSWGTDITLKKAAN